MDETRIIYLQTKLGAIKARMDRCRDNKSYMLLAGEWTATFQELDMLKSRRFDNAPVKLDSSKQRKIIDTTFGQIELFTSMDDVKQYEYGIWDNSKISAPDVWYE